MTAVAVPHHALHQSLQSYGIELDGLGSRVVLQHKRYSRLDGVDADRCSAVILGAVSRHVVEIVKCDVLHRYRSAGNRNSRPQSSAVGFPLRDKGVVLYSAFRRVVPPQMNVTPPNGDDGVIAFTTAVFAIRGGTMDQLRHGAILQKNGRKPGFPFCTPIVLGRTAERRRVINRYFDRDYVKWAIQGSNL